MEVVAQVQTTQQGTSSPDLNLNDQPGGNDVDQEQRVIEYYEDLDANNLNLDDDKDSEIQMIIDQEEKVETPEDFEMRPRNRIRLKKTIHPSLRKHRRQNPSHFRKAFSEEGQLNEIQAEDLEKRLKALAAAFTERTKRTKKKIQQPPTPSSGESDSEETNKSGEPTLLDRLRHLTTSPGESDFGDTPGRRKSVVEKVRGTCMKKLKRVWNVLQGNYILDPQSFSYVSWLFVVAVFFAYNACAIPLRVVFPYQTKENEWKWFVADTLADLVYLIDMIAFKPHVKFIQSGFWVKEPTETMKTYLAGWKFKIDMAALLPVDIFLHFFYKNLPICRLPRFLKMGTFGELFRQLDTLLANPHRARIFHTCLYMLYMIHLFACFYYAVSTIEGIGTTSWTFDGYGNAYIRCFYFATKTATSIGKNPKPENETEYVFMTFAWLSGVFVTAILIGQIRDIIATATKSQTEYRFLTLATFSYLHRLGVPPRLENRVKLWLSYTWEQQKTLDERKILNLLPKTMKAEVALNIHMETLAKVQLFQNCETAFIRDLVVKLRSIIILPGDFVCRKGEIGREMFIVKSGKINVIGGPSGIQVLASLGEGSVFGEIALLGIGGMTKRTADVKAAGFVNLFVLNKYDLNDVIRDYPEAQEIMQRKAKKLMRENIKKARASPIPVAADEGVEDDRSLSQVGDADGIIIKNKAEPPKLIATILKLFPPQTTKIGRYLTQGFNAGSSTDVSQSSSNIFSDFSEEDDNALEIYDAGSNNSRSKSMNYTFLNSYPPSPYIPTSPGHISPELDISLGDSTDHLLSPGGVVPEHEAASSKDVSSLSGSGVSPGMEPERKKEVAEVKERENIPVAKRPPLYSLTGKTKPEVGTSAGSSTFGVGATARAAQFIRKIRSPFQKQSEIDIEVGGEVGVGDKRKAESQAAYNLDIDSD